MDYDIFKSEIRKEALKTPSTEACGLIIKKNDGFSVFPCRNEAADKNHKFIINQKDFLKGSLLGEIRAVYHTHVNANANFSFLDKINCLHHGYDFLLYFLKNNSLFSLKTDKAWAEYLEKTFTYGQFDCYNVVRKYYKTELNVDLPEINDYEEKFKEWKNENLFKEFYQKYGLRDGNDINQLRKHDILLFNFYKSFMPPHFAIYLGNGYVLHHPRNGFVQIELLGPMTNKIICYLRHDRCLN